MSKSKFSESGDILRRLGTFRVLKFCHLNNYHLWLYPEPADGLPSNTVCITHDGGVAILGVFRWNLYQLVQGWRWQSRRWSPPISFQEDLQEAEVTDNFQLYALFSTMAFTPRPWFPGSYFQLMREHSRDSRAGHSCPMWDLPMGTLWLETLHCPAKTFSSCTTVRSYSSLELRLPISLHRCQTCNMNRSLPLLTPESSILFFAVFPSISLWHIESHFGICVSEDLN